MMLVSLLWEDFRNTRATFLFSACLKGGSRDHFGVTHSL